MDNSADVRRRGRLIFRGGVTLLIMGAIFFFSAQPSGDSSRLSEFLLNTEFGQLLMRLLPSLSDQGDAHDIRKYAHMTEFFCLGVSALMFARELFRGKARRGLLSLSAAWLFCLFYACTDEVHQLFVEGRSCQLSDVGVDGIGFTAGMLVCLAALLLARPLMSETKRPPEEGGTE